MSINPQFHRVYSSHEYETFTFPKEILYDPNLTGNALKILLIMLDYGKRPNWQLRQTHLLCVSKMGYEKFSTSMKVLEKAGYVKRERERVKGKWTPYSYKFSAFPIFLEKEDKNPLHNEYEPDRVFQTGITKLENPNFTYSTNNVLEETTKPEEEKPNLVSSSFEKLKELENIEKISESQKATLYKKYSHEQILNAIKAINIEEANCVFAVLISAIKENWKPRETKQNKILESIKVFQQAESYLSRLGYSPISIAMDNKNAYIYIGTATSVYPLSDENFKEKFSKDINNYIKKK